MKTSRNVESSSQRPARRPSARSQRGFTMAEVLVAVTVLAVLFVVVFALYDNLQRTFKMSENAATQQQNTRVAFDRMVADIRMAGFNYNPDGDPNRTDEQIEGMWDNAVTVRGDFDFEDPTARVTPESTLGGAGMTFRTVSTGNDEIVTYALGLPAGTGGSNVSFVADVAGVPRNGSKETVTVANVHLSQTSPPYTLYRILVQPNSTSVVRQPVADNIKEMSFAYYDGAGNVLAAAGGADDPNSMDQRRRISKIGINVVGMTEDPDLAYIDPTDANSATRHFRKFTLATDVTPRNLGMIGVVDIDLDDPNAPANFTACQGHCNGTLLKWDSGGDPDISSYTVSWGTSASTMTNVISTSNLNHYISGITGPHYYAARSVDMVGNQSANVMVGPSTPTDSTTPGATSSLTCSGDAAAVRAAQDSVVQLAWAPISGNTVNLSCDVSPYPIRDLRGYRVYKGATAGFDPNNVSQVLQSWDPNSVPATVSTLTDSQVVNCRRYYYKARGEDLCSKLGAVSSVADGASTTSVLPASPTSLQAIDMGLGIHQVTWSRVTQNSNPTPANIMIDKYGVYRAVVDLGDDPNNASYSLVWSGLVSNPSAPDYSDPSVPNIPGNQRYYYRVSAMDDCPNESALSLPDEADACNFGGNAQMSISPGGSTLTGNQTITLSATGGVTIQATQLVIKNYGTGTVVFNGTDNTAPYVYTFNVSSQPAGTVLEFIGMVTNASGCTDSESTMASTATVISCCIVPNNPTISPTTGSLKNNEVYYDIINNCGDDAFIQAWNVRWTDNGGSGALLDRVQYNIFNQLTSMVDIDLSPDAPPTASIDLSVSPLSPLRLLVGNDATAPVRIMDKFTQPMLKKVGSVWIGESIETEYFFTLATQGGTGRCNITVVTNPLSLVACDPASDPNC